MSAIRDEEYAAVVERERPLLQATAYLLMGDPVQAERVVQLAFAQLYGRWPRASPRVEAIRVVVQTARAPVHLPWESRERVELIDGPPPVAAAEPIVADLRTLGYDQRVAIVLESYSGLRTPEIADILGRSVSGVHLLAGQAREVLAINQPDRTNDETLLSELQDAIPYELRESHGSADDLSHGRRLSYGRWLRRGSATLVAVVLVIVAAALLIPTRQPVPQAAPSVPISTPSSQNCDPATTDVCRWKILFKWRSDMAEIATSYLDPKGDYFSGFGYAYDTRYDMPSFWAGDGGALALEMFRLDKGATEVYVQIATSHKFAVPCGTTTHQHCLALRFMDGNRFMLTDSTVNNGGIEVQYSPSGDEVITVIARNTQRGQVLDVGSGDLIRLVQDPRLHLPKR
jgi:DNA-directed RNA polymerase specialized sigma24 family protein